MVAVGVDVFLVVGAAVSCEQFEDLGGEVSVILGKSEKVVDGATVTEGRSRGLFEGQIEGKFEFAAECSNRSNDVGAVDGAAVPGVSGALCSFDENVGRRNLAVVGGNSD